jgi:HSP20 family protein
MADAPKLPAQGESENRPAPLRPWLPFDSLRDEVDRVFHTFRAHPLWRSTAFDVAPFFRREGFLTAPAVDVAETDAAYEITVELPGLDERNVEIAHANGILAIRGEKREESENKQRDYYVSERRYGSFERSFRIPDSVDEGKISAAFNKGVLAVTLPKTQQTRQPEKKIEIKPS